MNTPVCYAVHSTKHDAIGAVEIVFLAEKEARAYAADRSRDYHVLSTSVTRFTVGELGTRHPVCWYRDGSEQPPRVHNPKIRQLYPHSAHPDAPG